MVKKRVKLAKNGQKNWEVEKVKTYQEVRYSSVMKVILPL